MADGDVRVAAGTFIVNVMGVEVRDILHRDLAEKIATALWKAYEAGVDAALEDDGD